MKDYLVKAISNDGMIRMYANRTTNLIDEARQRHSTMATASAALGRTLSISSMMGSMLKNNERLSVTIDGGGPLGKIVVNSDSSGNVSGVVSNPRVDFKNNTTGKLDVGFAVGTEGTIAVTKDLGLKDLFTGNTPLISGEIAEDFTYYFTISEQTPSAVSAGVLVSTEDASIISAGGFIVQLMPGATEEVISTLESKLANVAPCSEMIVMGKTPEDIIELVLGEDNFKVIETTDIRFHCSCSKDKFSRGISSLGNDEIQAIIEENEEIETVCHFCNEKYIFTRDEIKKIRNM